MEVEIEATAALFDHVDGWQSRRRVLPLDVEPELEDLPVPEEWVGGGEVLRATGRRLVWRSRGAKLELAEVPSAAFESTGRNGMELPFPILSRDAVCFEEVAVAASRDEGLVVWALTRNLVLYAVPFKPPHSGGSNAGGRGGGTATASPASQSLLAALPTREACDGVALSPPAGSDYPSCCAFVTPRDLLIGYGTGKVQVVRVTRQSVEVGVPQTVHAEVTRELPASGYLSYLNPLSYRQAAQPTTSPVIAVGGLEADSGELLVFSLHADRKLRVWSTRSKGVLLSELALPGAMDRGLLYSACSKVAVHMAGSKKDNPVYRLVISLTEPSHSRIWVSKPFASPSEVEGWKDTHLGAHCFEENQLVADVRLAMEDDKQGSGGLRLWAALANDGLAYATLATGKGGSGGGNVGGRPASLFRMWQAPSSGLEDIRLLLGGGFKGGEEGRGSRRDALRSCLLQLHARLGLQWQATTRYVEATFLRVLAAPTSRFSSMALLKATERMKSVPSLNAGRESGRRGGKGEGGVGGDTDRDPLPTGERLWELVTSVVRKEADRALAEAARQPSYRRQQDKNEAEGEKRALALLSSWSYFLYLAEQSREILGQPLALVRGGSASTAVMAVRVDRCSTVVPVRLPVPRTLTFLDAFDGWLRECAPGAVLDMNRHLSEALVATGQLPDPVLLKAKAAEALLQRQPGMGAEAGLVLRGAGETRIELDTSGFQAMEEVEEVLDNLRSLLRILREKPPRGASPTRGRDVRRRGSTPIASSTSMEVEEAVTGGKKTSVAIATVAACAVREILALCLARLRTSLLLLVHLESAGLQQVLPKNPSEDPLTLQVATALNRTWLLCYSGSQPQLAPMPIRPPSAIVSTGATERTTRPVAVLEALALHGRSTASLDVREVIQGMCQGLPRRLMAHLSNTEQYRYLLPWARGLLDGALLLPFGADEDDGVVVALTRWWQRLVVYAYLSEARRMARRGQGKAAESLFSRAIKALKEWDTCLAPPYSKDEGNEEDDERPAPIQGDSNSVLRLAHYVEAVGLLEQSVGLPGCAQPRLADLAYAGLRHVEALPDMLPAVGDREARDRLKWCHKHAAALWATVFRACTDHGGEGDAGGDTGAFEEAFLAMRAELAVGHDLEEMMEQEEEEEGGAARAAASRRSRNSKLSYLIVELCERGRIDLVCSLPWAQGDAEDEVSDIENCLRSSARFSTIEGGDEKGAADASSGEGVDYYKAAYAFLVRQRNYRQAALEMYRLAKRLEDATVYEDNVARLDRKIEALAAVHNCLCVVEEGGEYPFLLWTFDNNKAQPTTDAGTSKRTCVVTLQRVEQELTYAMAVRQYLLVAGPEASPLRPLSLLHAHAQVEGASNTKLSRATLHQVESTSAMLCGAGLYESAVALVKAFGLPMHAIVAALAKTYVMLRSGRADAPMVLEDGPRWNLGDPDELPADRQSEMEEDDDEAARRDVYLRLAEKLAEEGDEAKVVAEHAEAAGWLLKDLVQGYDWAHAFELHTVAARYILACDSFFKPPKWLHIAFTRGVDAQFVKKTKQKGGGSANLGVWRDKSMGQGVTRVNATNSGAFLQMHVDKAMYLLTSGDGMRGGRDRVPALPAEGVLIESLHLLVRALGYGKDIVDASSEQLLEGAKKVWLPRFALVALFQRTREVLEMAAGNAYSQSEALETLREEAKRGLKDLSTVFNHFEGHLGDRQQMEALGGNWLHQQAH